MLDSIYHRILKLLKNHIFWRENNSKHQDVAIFYATL